MTSTPQPATRAVLDVSSSPVDISSARGAFGWSTIDSVNIPFVLRDEKQYVSVRMVEQKLLSKYPSTYPPELQHRAPLVSHHVTEPEATLLNEINIEHCAGEYGKSLFTIKDLIVRQADFEAFYKIVKKYFPDVTDKRRATRTTDERDPSGISRGTTHSGWFQVNATVVPFITRNGVACVPLSVIRYGACLLMDKRVPGFLPSQDEVQILNSMCRQAEVKFTFTQTHKLIAIHAVSENTDGGVRILQLPKDDPFTSALSNQMAPPSYGFMGAAGINPNTLTSTPNNAYLQAQLASPNHGYMGSGLPNQLPSQSHAYLPNQLPSPNNAYMATDLSRRLASPNQGFNPQQPMSPHLPLEALNPTVPNIMFSPARLPFVQGQQLSPLAQNLVTHAAVNNNRLPPNHKGSAPHAHHRQGAVSAPHDPYHQTAAVSAPYTPTARQAPSRSNSRSNRASSVSLTNTGDRSCPYPTPPASKSPYEVIPNPIQCIQSVEFEGRNLSCLLRGPRNVPHALVEAVCRLYFRHCKLNDFLFVLENIVGVCVSTLVPEEEQLFIDFYSLPTKSLKCNRTIRLEDLKANFAKITNTLNRKESITALKNDKLQCVPANKENSKSDETAVVRLVDDIQSDVRDWSILGESTSGPISTGFGSFKKRAQHFLRDVMTGKKRSSSTESNDSERSQPPAKQPKRLEDTVRRIKALSEASSK